MKNVSSIQKNNKNESPKTPGGISKSLLTPCRRVGLSRNWRKSCSSPFVSPLATPDGSEPKREQESRKRKSSTIDESSQDSSQTSNKTDDLIETQISCNTPRTNTNQTPRSLLPRKKSKTLLLTKDCEEENENIPQVTNVNSNENSSPIASEIKKDSPKNIKVTKLARTNSKNKSKIIESPKDLKVAEQSQVEEKNKVSSGVEEKISENIQIECKQKSPADLKKECVIVLQKKIFKCDQSKDSKVILHENNPVSQVLFDSDSEDIPLSKITKTSTSTKPLINEDDEFQESKKVKLLQHKTTSTSELKKKPEPKPKPVKNKTKPKNPRETTIKSSQDSTDLEDDDFISDKRTILIKKTYDKVSKLSKARSTGSITQKDIDELKQRIEAKKNLLLAKAMTNETAELRTLIKKWQKGCQNALTELLELMRAKMPEQKNMEYSEILQSLKIPPDLVGYDSENDCFNTPDDANIILSDFDVK